MSALRSYVNTLWSQTKSDNYAEPVTCWSQSFVLGARLIMYPHLRFNL